MSDLLTGTGPDDYDASSIEHLDGMEAVRKRPGMYIGGTDERALHHMAAEIIDNSMDEAVAGFASRIEVTLNADYSLTVTDNGRGIPIDPHPKFPDKSALEVIFTELHAGGKFSGKAYQTSGGLHGVGSTVVNALSDSLIVRVAKNRELFEQSFARGIPQGPLAKVGAAPNRRGTEVTFHADDQIFGSHRFKPRRLFTLVRSKAFLFSGVEIRWKSAIDDGDTPTEATFHFPGGLKRWAAPPPMPSNPLAAKWNFARNLASRAMWNGRSTGRPRATVSCKAIATPCPPPRAAPMSPAFGRRS